MHGTAPRIKHFEQYLVGKFRLTSIQAECVVVSLQQVLRERKPPQNVIPIRTEKKYFRLLKGGQARGG